MYDISQLNELLVTELVDIADELNVSNSKKMNKSDLVKNIMDKQADNKNISESQEEKPRRKRINKNDVSTSVKDEAVQTKVSEHAAAKPVESKLEENKHEKDSSSPKVAIPEVKKEMIAAVEKWLLCFFNRLFSTLLYK